MAKIEGFRIRNFKSLKDVTLGRLWKNPQEKPLTPMTVVIGKNGVGKSTLFDAFGFLSDCLISGVEKACDIRGRGGFKNILTQGEKGPVEFEVCYKENENTNPITYILYIDLDESERPRVLLESLLQEHKRGEFSQVNIFLFLYEGKGLAWKENQVGPLTDLEEEGFDFEELINYIKKKEVPEGSEPVEFKDPRKLGIATDLQDSAPAWWEFDDLRKLGIATLGSLKQHPRISSFRRFIEGWYLSYFTPDAARGLPLAGPQKHLNIHGDNLGNVVQFMERDHPERFQAVLDRIAGKIPGIGKIATEKTKDGRLLLKFNDKGFRDPFYAQQMSDGTLKFFAYLLLLEDPDPPPFLCIEEPENGLYHKLLESLAMEFREHATDSQVFITTHQPYFVNGLNPEEVWILGKGPDGFSTIQRASENPTVTSLVDQELPLGGLWYSDYLDAR